VIRSMSGLYQPVMLFRNSVGCTKVGDFRLWWLVLD
jgi:hypothetical protein